MRLFLICYVLIVPLILGAQPNNNLWNGHQAFASGAYDEAIEFYQMEIADGNTWDWLPEMIQTVEQRKLLGEINPESIQRIGAIFVTELNLLQNGDTISSIDVTQDQIVEWLIIFDVVSRTIEAWSNGALSLQFDSITTTSYYIEDDVLKPDNPDHLALERYFHQTMPEYDSYVTLSNTRSPARGLARKYPYIHSEIYGPHRGMFAVNAGSHGFPTFLHEFFHTIEWVSGVANGVTHGYRDENRHNFPNWTGNTEYDYYRWHFAENIPEVGWEKLLHRNRWVPLKIDTTAWQEAKTIYQNILLADRLEADSLYEEAKNILNTQPNEAVQLFEQSLQLSPLNLPSLSALYDYIRMNTPDTTVEQDLYEKLNLVRRIEDWYTIEEENESFGEVFQKWHPEDIPLYWDYATWKITSLITEPGCYSVSFYYTEGWDALQIDSVYLSDAENQVISRDDHYGFSGTNKTDITYELKIPQIESTDYFVHAKIYADGDTNSFGQLHTKKEQDTQEPSISCPGSVTIDPTSQVADFVDQLAVSDNCALKTITQIPSPGASYNMEDSITFIAEDYAGNTNSCKSVVETVTSTSSRLTDNLKIFPNPSKKAIYVTRRIDQMSLFDNLGRLIRKSDEPMMNVGDLRAGIYFMSIKIDQQITTHRVILE